MIMGSANTPENIMKYYYRLSLTKCSLNLIEIPKKCPSSLWQDIYEYCVRQMGMIPIAVYKRHSDEAQPKDNNGHENLDGGLNNKSDEKQPKKSYVWLHP